jgi:hypothetical protein
MAHPRIRLFDVPEGAGFRFDGEPPDGSTPRDPDLVETEIQAAVAAGAQWIVLGKHEPTAHPDLNRLLWQVEELGARGKATSNGRRLADQQTLERLRDASLAQLTLVFYGGTAETHDRLVGHDGAFELLVEALDLATRINRLLVTARYVLLSDNADEVGELVARVRSAARRFELVRLSAITRDEVLLSEHGLSRRRAVAAVQSAWEAARVTHLEFSTLGFTTFPAMPRPSDATVQPADRTLLEMLRANVPVPGAANGTWATPTDGDVSGIWYAAEASRTLHELGLQLAAYGVPALDLPTSMGGMGMDRPPGADEDTLALRRKDGVPRLLSSTLDDVDARPLPAWTGCGEDAEIVVVNGWSTDNVLALSTLRALARHLGTERYHSVWDRPFNPFDVNDPLDDAPAFGADVDPEREGWTYAWQQVEATANTPARIAHARKHHAAWLETLDLSGADLVVVPGFETALAIWDHPTLPGDARVVIADYHLGTGLPGWHGRFLQGRAMDGGWWPDERLLVHAIYPRYVRTYWRAGVPLRQLVWRPYPVDTAHFPPGPPVSGCTTLFAGGAHQRDWATLSAAARLAGVADRLAVYTPDPVPPPVANQGEVRLLHFYEALANSRFVVLPLNADIRRPAGISVISMALAAGRPVIATATPATVDHLRHGHNAILVPPGRPKALAKAIRRLDEDTALLERLAAGARRAADHVSVEAWAHELVHGRPEQANWSMSDDGRGPFYSWPA